MYGGARRKRKGKDPTVAMDLFVYFLKGVGIGFLVAAPVGPVAAMCVHRTLAHGVLAGGATGLGAAVADTFYGVVAAYGVSFLASVLLGNEVWFRLVGGLVLCGLAVKAYLAGPAEARNAAHEGLAGDFLSALVVTGTNPITIVAFGVIFTTFGIVDPRGGIGWAAALIAGVFLGSALWWGLLTGVARLFRSTLSHAGLRWINRVSAAVILSCGLIVLIGALAPESAVAELFELRFFGAAPGAANAPA